MIRLILCFTYQLWLNLPVLFSLLVLTNTGHAQSMQSKVLQQIAPNGELTAAIYTGNFLLVTGKDVQGAPIGVSPDMAKAIADKLGVKLVLKPFKSQGEAVDAVANGECTIVLVGSDPARAERIDFAPAYVEIEATYMVSNESRYKNVSDVDAPGVRIAVFDVSAYGLVKANGLGTSLELFISNKLDALAGLRPGLVTDLQSHPGYRVLDGHFMTVEQAIATKKGNNEALNFLTTFTEESKSSGLVKQLIEKHNIQGSLSVAPMRTK